MNKSLLILLTLSTLLFHPLNAQNNKRLPDKVIGTNGKEYCCRILSIDSTKIDFIVIYSGTKVETHKPMSAIASYTYNGKEVYLQSVINQSTKNETQSAIYSIPAWKESHYPLHTDNQPELVTRLSILVPGIMFENKLSNSKTFYIHFWTGLSYNLWEINGVKSSETNIYPGITIGARKYNNLDFRQSRGKRVDFFSGTYLNIPLSILLTWEGVAIQLAAQGGFQRTLGRKGYWNIEIGPGIANNMGQISFGLTGNLGIGIILSKE